MDIRLEISNELWGTTDLPNRMSHTELEDLIDQLADLTQRIVDAHTEATLDYASYDAARAAHLDRTTSDGRPVIYETREV